MNNEQTLINLKISPVILVILNYLIFLFRKNI